MLGLDKRRDRVRRKEKCGLEVREVDLGQLETEDAHQHKANYTLALK